MVAVTLKSKTTHPGRHTGNESPDSNLDTLRWRIATRQHGWRPPTDVYETEDAIIVRVEIAGVRDSDFSVNLVDRSLLIRGTRQDIQERRSYHQMEIPFGEFSTEIELMIPVASDKIEAVYRDGFLRVTLPKARPYQIKVGE